MVKDADCVCIVSYKDIISTVEKKYDHEGSAT